MQEILNKFAGRVIEAEQKDGFEFRDILVVRLRYCRVKRHMKLDLEDTILNLLRDTRLSLENP